MLPAGSGWFFLLLFGIVPFKSFLIVTCIPARHYMIYVQAGGTREVGIHQGINEDVTMQGKRGGNSAEIAGPQTFHLFFIYI